MQWNQKVELIVEMFRERNPAIHLVYVVNHPNQGSARTRNIGISQASGEYITFLDDDDIYLPEKIAHQVEQMEHEHADYSITDICLFSDKGKQIEKRTRSYIKGSNTKLLTEYHLMYHMTGTDSFMFRKEYLLKIGCFDAIDLGDEFYLMQKAISGGGTFCYVPHCDIHAFVHAGEVGLSSGQNKIRCETEFFETINHKSRRYIQMRHYAVLAFAYLRMKKPIQVIKNGMLSFIASPVQCCMLLWNRGNSAG